MSMFDMLGKMGELKKKMADANAKLESIEVSAESADGSIRVIATGKRNVKSISINDQMLTAANKEQLQELIVSTVNQVLEQADAVAQTELKSATDGMLPNIPGMG